MSVEIYSAGNLVSSAKIIDGAILSWGEEMYISSGGTATTTTVEMGDLTVLAGGVAYDTTVEVREMHVSSGGIAYNTVVTNGELEIEDGGVASGVTIQSGAEFSVSSGGTAIDVDWTPGCGDVSVKYGATVSFVKEIRGAYFTEDDRLVSHYSSGTSNLRIGANEKLLIFSGGITRNLTASGSVIDDEEAEIEVNSGGSLCGVSIDRAGYLNINGGGYVSGAIINQGGRLSVEATSRTYVYGSSAGVTFNVSNGVLQGNGVYFYYARIYAGAKAYNIVGEEIQVENGGSGSNLNGDITVNCGGVVYDTVLKHDSRFEYIMNAQMSIKYGGIAHRTVVKSTGTLEIRSGGVASTTTVSSGGVMYISSGGIHRGGLQIAAGAMVSVDDGATVDFTVAGRTAAEDYLINDLSLIDGAPIYTITVAVNQSSGIYRLAANAGNFTGSIMIGDNSGNYGSIVVNGSDFIHRGKSYSLDNVDGNLTLSVIAPDSTPPAAPNAVASVTALTNKDVMITVTYSDDSFVKQYRIGDGAWQNYLGAFSISENDTIYFRAEDAAGNESTGEVVISNIDKAAPAVPEGFKETVSASNVKLDWSDALDGGIAGVKGYYIRYGTSENLPGEGEFTVASEFNLTDLATGTYCYQVKTVDKAGNVSEWSAIQSFDIKVSQKLNLQGNSNALSWDAIPEVKSYTVAYSRDNFSHTLSFDSDTNCVDTFGMPAGSYQCQVSIDGELWQQSSKFPAADPGLPQKLVSDADGNIDLFFACARSRWESGYEAQHLGICDGWNGTGEKVMLAGKNKLADVFAGSSDANILVMTDSANGDALFVDDVYSALGDQARIVQIDEIRAGAGDDIVDLTSQRFTYAGAGVTVYGGFGNDTIWANDGCNALFGDAGSDRLVGGSGNDFIIGGSGSDSMYGGGGDDIFCFGGDWGKDTVEQFDGGSVTLWFENGSESNWNSATLTYTDGANRVTVSGVAGVTLRFGADISLPAGCFDDAASEKSLKIKIKACWPDRLCQKRKFGKITLRGRIPYLKRSLSPHPITEKFFQKALVTCGVRQLFAFVTLPVGISL